MPILAEVVEISLYIHHNSWVMDSPIGKNQSLYYYADFDNKKFLTLIKDDKGDTISIRSDRKIDKYYVAIDNEKFIAF